MSTGEILQSGWERVADAIEQVRNRLLRATAALEASQVPYCVIGGNAVIDSQARIGGNTVVLGGNAVYETDDSITGNAYVLGGHLSKMGGHVKSARRFSVSPIVFSLLGILTILLLSVFFFPRVRRRDAVSQPS